MRRQTNFITLTRARRCEKNRYCAQFSHEASPLFFPLLLDRAIVWHRDARARASGTFIKTAQLALAKAASIETRNDHNLKRRQRTRAIDWRSLISDVSSSFFARPHARLMAAAIYKARGLPLPPFFFCFLLALRRAHIFALCLQATSALFASKKSSTTQTHAPAARLIAVDLADARRCRKAALHIANVMPIMLVSLRLKNEKAAKPKGEKFDEKMIIVFRLQRAQFFFRYS